MERNAQNQSPYYPDVRLFLVLIPFINAINYYLTYPNIKFNGHFFLTFTLDTVDGYIAWYSVRRFILYLDQRLPYGQGLPRRLMVQFVGTALIGLGIISLLTESTSFLAKGRPAPLEFYTVDLVIIGIWLFFINAIYLGLYYLNQSKRMGHKLAAQKKAQIEGLLVKVGKKDLKLDFDQIAGFQTDSDYTMALDITGKKFYMDDSLEKIGKKLPSETFFRLNRQYILHRNLISDFRRIENGKLLVLLHANDLFPSEIPVSRIKAPNHKFCCEYFGI